MSTFFILLILIIYSLSINQPYHFILLFVLVLFYALRFKKKRKNLLILLGIMSLHLGLKSIHQSAIFYQGIVVEAKENYYLFCSVKGSFYVKEKNNKKEEGDILVLKGKSERVQANILESQFDFSSYLKKKGYRYELKVTEEKYQFRFPLRKKAFVDSLANHVDSDTFYAVKRILIRLDSKEDYTLKSIEKKMQFYALFTLSTTIYSWIKSKAKKDKKYRFLLLVLIPFFFLSPTRLFFKRFFCDLFLEYYIKKKNLQLSKIKKRSIEAIIILLIHPFYALQMEYLITYTIVLSFHLLTPLLKGIKRAKRRWILYGIMQVIVMLFQGYMNHSVNFFTPFLSLVSPIFYILQIVIVLFSFLKAYRFLEIVIQVYQKIASSFSLFNYSFICGRIAFSFILFFLFCVFYIFLKRIKKEQNKCRWIALTLCSCFIIKMSPVQIKRNQIHFMNVGQGDATFIECEGIYTLIDTGGLSYLDIAEDVLIPYFKKKRIRKIHHLFITHHDFDHNGGKEGLIENGWVKEVHEGKMENPLILSSFFTIQNLNLWQSEMEDENDRSLVLSIQIRNTNILIMGDASKKIERKMILQYPSLKHDILKIGHHGSNTSSSLAFLKAVQPKVAIISCGKNNRYGHPSKETVAALNTLNIPYYRTDEKGTISFSIQNTFSFFFQSRYLWYTYRRKKESFYAISFIWSSRHDFRKAM